MGSVHVHARAPKGLSSQLEGEEETCSVSRMSSGAARWCAVTLHEASTPLGF